jgi:hypothetical protein
MNEVINYFKNIALVLDPSLKFWEQYFDDENIPSSILNKTFQIMISETRTESLNDNFEREDYSVRVSFFFKAKKDNHSDVVSSLDYVNIFKRACLHPSAQHVLANIKTVKCDRIIPEFLPSNDNALRVRLEFSVNRISNL